MVQDLRTNLVTLLDGLSVTHQGSPVSLPAAYWSDATLETLPAIFIRSATSSIEEGDTGGGAERFTGTYDVAIQALDTDSIDGESFLSDAADAINTAIRATRTSFGDAYFIRLVSDVTLPVETLGGVNVYGRTLSYRASSVEFF